MPHCVSVEGRRPNRPPVTRVGGAVRDPDRADEPARDDRRRLWAWRRTSDTAASSGVGVYSVDYVVNIAIPVHLSRARANPQPASEVTDRVATKEDATPRTASAADSRARAPRGHGAGRSGGIEALSMRRLGQELGVDAMALYRHVRDKDDLLDGVVEVGRRRDRADPAGRRLEDRPARAGHGGTTGDAAPPVGAARPRGARHGRSGVARPHRCGPRDPPRRRVLDGARPSRAARRWAAGSSGSTRTCSTTRAARPRPRPPRPGSSRWLSASRPSPSSPRRRATKAASAACDDDVEFAFGLDLVLDGLERRRERQGSSIDP